MKKQFLILAVAFMGYSSFLNAAYTLKNGKFINTNEVATLSVQEHYSLAQEAFQNAKWDECLKQSIIVRKNFPTSPFVHEVTFYLSVSYFYLKEYDLSNHCFSEYLRKEAPSKHFEEAIAFKFKIAEKFKEGAKKHILGKEALPKWLPAKEEALAIYDEVIAALPHHDLGAQALFGKANLLFDQDEFQEGIETFQTLIRRFPKHPLAPESYILIGKTYLDQSKDEYPDPDLLELADINMRKFHLDFPTEPRFETLKKMHVEMQEVYAKSLYETGKFYERTKKPHAAILYYSKIVAKYPDSNIAKLCNKRLEVLKPKIESPPEIIAQVENEVPVEVVPQEMPIEAPETELNAE